jgi:menaquinone-dependent protoporphyrinogen oxidase
VKFLNKIKWKPTLTAVFAGKLNYKIYTFKERVLIKWIMLITKGPINSRTEIEYTNWDEVNKFVKELTKI